MDSFQEVLDQLSQDDGQMVRFLILLQLSRNDSLEASDLGRLIRQFGVEEIDVPRMLLLMQHQGEVYWRPDRRWAKGPDPALAAYASMPGH